MSVKVAANGQRSVQVEVEVPGSPEQVWQAIATGPGISSWFVPTQVEEREGGAVKANFGPGMESESTITQWNPPQTFVAEGSGMTPEAPPMATQWIVEAKSGDTCVVRVVHSWFASTDEWDGQFESVESGWNAFFKILRLKLQHFPNQPSAAFDVAGMGDDTAWTTLTTQLGLSDQTIGKQTQSPADAPSLAGKITEVTDADEKHLMLLTSEPGPGICHLFAIPMGGPIYLSVRFFLFGEGAPTAIAQSQPEWTTWFTDRFPMGG